MNRLCRECERSIGARPGCPCSRCQGRRRFCNKRCFDKWQRRSRRAHVCRTCRKTFTRPPSTEHHDPPVFCSWRCTTVDYQRRASPATRWCPLCEEEKPISAFSRRGGRRPGYQHYCRCCVNRRTRGAGDAKTIRRLLWFQEGRCAYCRELLGASYHVDHMTPIARGGTSDPANLALACARCNLRKRTRTATEFLEAVA